VNGQDAQPAGWYPAPGDTTSERYWDGAAWTPSYRPVGSSAPSSHRTEAPRPAETVAFFKRRGVKIAAGAIVVLGLLGSVVEETPTTEDAADEQPEPAADQESAPPPAQAPAQAEGPSGAPAPAPVDVPEPSSDLPADQTAFIALIREYETLYDEAATDLQRANVRVQRRQALCDLIPGRSVSNWIGEVDVIGGNSDGDAHIDLEISNGINIGTWNNRVSDIFDNTLVPNTSPLYGTLLTLMKGDRVVFSGEFMASSDECLKTANLTEVFDMSRPDFKFRFSAIDRP
jgi:hypothetical protein